MCRFYNESFTPQKPLILNRISLHSLFDRSLPVPLRCMRTVPCMAAVSMALISSLPFGPLGCVLPSLSGGGTRSSGARLRFKHSEYKYLNTNLRYGFKPLESQGGMCWRNGAMVAYILCINPMDSKFRRFHPRTPVCLGRSLTHIGYCIMDGTNRRLEIPVYS